MNRLTGENLLETKGGPRECPIAVKTITALRDRKRKNAHGQGENTRAGGYIRDAEAKRNAHMETDASARTVMISLNIIDEDNPQSVFPPLVLEDTYMKSQYVSQGLGDSRRTDGMLWHMGGVGVGVGLSSLPQSTSSDSGGGEQHKGEDQNGEGLHLSCLQFH
jgi:hypothetical protein